MEKQILKVTLNDVAKKAKVSMSTASQAINNIHSARINNKTRDLVIKTAEELGYRANRIAQSLANGKTGIIGLAISGFVTPLFSTSFFSELIRGVGIGLEESGYNLLLLHVKKEAEPDQLYRETIGTGLLDGIMLEGNFIKDEFVLRLEEEKFPYVLIGRELIQKEINYIKLDYFGGSSQSVKHLIKLGHSRIGFIGGTKIKTMTNMVEREKGYFHELKENGIKPIPDFIVRCDNLTYDEGYKSMQKILKNHLKPTAIIAGHDSLAIGAMNAIKENGFRIPEDIAVIGFDDTPESLMVTPRLTTVKFPLFDLGRTGADMLNKILSKEGSNIKEQQVLPTQLIVRESCSLFK
jgi:LacI family transcriptional regulator